MYLISLLLYFACFSILSGSLIAIAWPRTTVLKQQLAFYEYSWAEAHDEVENEKTKTDDNIKTRLMIVISRLLSRGRPVLLIQTKLETAGMSIGWSEFTYYHFLGVCAGGVIAYLLGGLAFAVLVTAVAAWAPIFVLDYLIARRRSLFANQLPEILTMTSSALKTGYSLMQAVDMVAQESGPPASEEFKRVLTDSRLGLPVEQALDKMGTRVACTSFDWMVMAIKIQRDVGGNLAEVLETLARTIRERETVLRQIKALTAEGRLSAIILLCLPLFVTLALYLLNPGYMNLLFSTTAGITMLVAAASLMAIGTLWLRRVVKIEV